MRSVWLVWLPQWSLSQVLLSLIKPANPKAIYEALAHFRLQDKLYARFDRMSGGERQRWRLIACHGFRWGRPLPLSLPRYCSSRWSTCSALRRDVRWRHAASGLAHDSYAQDHQFIDNNNATEGGNMSLAATILIALVMLIHVYVVLLETVLFRSRGRKVFGLKQDQVEVLAPAMSNQGCYNGFLAAALAVALLHPDPAIGRAFAVFGFVCVAVAGVWGAVTVQKRILYVQTLPAVIGLIALYFPK
jgi:putative membrane protein